MALQFQNQYKQPREYLLIFKIFLKCQKTLHIKMVDVTCDRYNSQNGDLKKYKFILFTVIIRATIAFPSWAMFDFCIFIIDYLKSSIQIFTEITFYYFITFLNRFKNYIDWTKRLSQRFTELNNFSTIHLDSSFKTFFLRILSN